MSIQMTDEQIAIVNHTVNSSRNLMVEARAGAGKTSTIVEIGGAIHSSALCLAFNKKIAVEMQERLPQNCRASTLNSLGHRSVGKALRTRLQLDRNKNYDMLSVAVRDLPEHLRQDVLEDGGFPDMLEAIRASKQAGYVPHVPEVESMVEGVEFFASFYKHLTEMQMSIVTDVARASAMAALKGRIDFDDQILISTLYSRAGFDYYPVVLIDEAQDLSRLNHRMLQKIAKGGARVIAVGDPFQAIYAFRGADSESMNVLRDMFDMDTYKLTVNFRSDQDIIKNAHWRAPDMKWRDDAQEGEVLAFRTWSHDVVPDGAAVICRNNAPLFSMALNFLAAGRRAVIAEREMVNKLMGILEKLGPYHMPQEKVLLAIEEWAEKARSRHKVKDQIEDEVACLNVLARRGDTLHDILQFIRSIMEQKDGIHLMTIHKSKGMEWDTVFLLDADLIRLGEGQEDNLLYVAQTRARHSFNNVASEGYFDPLVDGSGLQVEQVEKEEVEVKVHA